MKTKKRKPKLENLEARIDQLDYLCDLVLIALLRNKSLDARDIEILEESTKDVPIFKSVKTKPSRRK